MDAEDIQSSIFHLAKNRPTESSSGSSHRERRDDDATAATGANEQVIRGISVGVVISGQDLRHPINIGGRQD